MAGYKKLICRLIVLVTTLSFVIGIQSQSRDERVEYARVIDGELYLHVAIPRGRIIEEATLIIGGETVPLKISPVPLDMTYWLIIDRSASVINTASAISNNLDRFIQAQITDGAQVGVIFYDVTPQVYHPTSIFADVQTWLSGYGGRSNTVGCVGDALNSLANLPRDPQRSQHVLLITGRLQRQGLCIEQGVTPVQSPVDVIVVADIVDDFYRDVTERSGGTLLRANVQTVGNRINEISALWSNPSYALTSTYLGTARQGRLNLKLSDGREVGLQVDLSFEQTESTAPVISLTTLDDPNVVPTIESIAELPPIIQPTSIPQEVVTDVIAPVVIEATAIPTQVITQPTAMQELVIEDAVSVPTQTSSEAEVMIEPVDALAEESQGLITQIESVIAELPEPLNQVSAVAVMVTIGVIVLLIVLLILRTVFRKPKTVNQSRFSEQYSSYNDIHTSTVLQEVTEINEVDTYPMDDELDLSEIIEIDDSLDYTEIIDDDDLFDRTEIITDDELLDQKRIMGELLIESTGDKYLISTPTTILGRLNTCDIVIDSTKISREHLCFYEKDGQLWVWVKSKNSILINNEIVREHQQIHIGDKLRLAPNLDAVVLAHEEDGA